MGRVPSLSGTARPVLSSAEALRSHPPGPPAQGRPAGPVLVALPPPYDLARTLTCGQVFRWTLLPDGAVGVYRRHRWRLRARDGHLEVGRAPSKRAVADLCRHLGLDAPLAAVEAVLAGDPVLRRVLPRTSGIALMRQDPWECLASFLISAYNNIPKIRLSVEALAQGFGEPLGSGAFTFPSAERLAEARLPALRACYLGYRAPYLREVARAVASRAVDLEALRGMAYTEARDRLLNLPGVGEKVADCVLLFALGHGQAFPVDIWVHRAVERAYLGGRRATPAAIRAWARERFGPLAGYANQHLFAAVRARLIAYAPIRAAPGKRRRAPHGRPRFMDGRAPPPKRPGILSDLSHE